MVTLHIRKNLSKALMLKSTTYVIKWRNWADAQLESSPLLISFQGAERYSALHRNLQQGLWDTGAVVAPVLQE